MVALVISTLLPTPEREMNAITAKSTTSTPRKIQMNRLPPRAGRRLRDREVRVRDVAGRFPPFPLPLFFLERLDVVVIAQPLPRHPRGRSPARTPQRTAVSRWPGTRRAP